MDTFDVPSIVRAIRAGAAEFLAKPVDADELVRAIELALMRDSAVCRRRAALEQLRRRLALLTPREREVFPLVTSGLRNKQAAVQLGISEVTVQIHRSQIMRKMAAGSFAELVRMGAQLHLSSHATAG
jgi:FixJ family two-component response regulator